MTEHAVGHAAGAITTVYIPRRVRDGFLFTRIVGKTEAEVEAELARLRTIPGGNREEARTEAFDSRALTRQPSEGVRWYVADARGKFTGQAPYKVERHAIAACEEFNASDAKGSHKPYSVVPLYTHPAASPVAVTDVDAVKIIAAEIADACQEYGERGLAYPVERAKHVLAALRGTV